MFWSADIHQFLEDKWLNDKSIRNKINSSISVLNKSIHIKENEIYLQNIMTNIANRYEKELKLNKSYRRKVKLQLLLDSLYSDEESSFDTSISSLNDANTTIKKK